METQLIMLNSYTKLSLVVGGLDFGHFVCENGKRRFCSDKLDISSQTTGLPNDLPSNATKKANLDIAQH